jgi:hypothetical protein
MSRLDDDPEETASEEGLDVILPGDSELFIDIDDDKDLAMMEKGIETLRHNGCTVEELKRTTSRSGNLHVYLFFELPSKAPIDPMTRIALQACLGSDRTREALSVLRIVLETKRPPTLFFEVPGKRAIELEQ